MRLRCASKLRCTAFCARGSSFRHFTLSVQLSHGETPLSCLWIAEPQNICPGSRHKRGGASHRHLPRTHPRLLVRELPATGPLPRAPGSRTSAAHEEPLPKNHACAICQDGGATKTRPGELPVRAALARVCQQLPVADPRPFELCWTPIVAFPA